MSGLPTPARRLGCLARIWAWIWALTVLGGAAKGADGPRLKIINGLPTTGFPAVAALLDPLGEEHCSATLIGCRTVMTAAHCVCRSLGSACQEGGPDLMAPEDLRVFLQNAGLFGVASIRVPENYRFGARNDAAILELSEEVTAVQPAAINDVFNPAPGTPGVIVGFGVTEAFGTDNGLKRMGEVVTETCTVVSDATNVCWQYTEPIGPEGEDSNSCYGDSGGPLFIDVGGALRVAGITAGGINAECLAADESWDTNVFSIRDWIREQAGSDLGQTCGALPRVGDPGVVVASAVGQLSGRNVDEVWTFNVPRETLALRVSLNGEEGIGNDLDLVTGAGHNPLDSDDGGCSSSGPGSFASCELMEPDAGTWYVRVRGDATGSYQLVVTIFGSTFFRDGFESGDTSAWDGSEP